MENQAPKQNQSVPVASAKNRILTKEKLCKRRWQGLSSCEFCGLFESTDHLFFKCSVARYIWRVVQIALNLHTIPTSTDDLFGPRGTKDIKSQKAPNFIKERGKAPLASSLHYFS